MDILGLLCCPDWALYTLAALLAVYFFRSRNYDFFHLRNIPYIRPISLVRNVIGMFVRKKSIAEMVNDNYKSASGHRCVGIYEFQKPIYVVRDPELIRIIGVNEFDHFMNRKDVVNENDYSQFSRNLFSLKDQKWRDMRATLSPAFTSSKMKAMFLLMVEIGQQLADHLEGTIHEQTALGSDTVTVELKDFYSRFTNDVIATAAFGIKVDSLKERKNEFYMMGKEVTSFGRFKMCIFVLYMAFPRLMSALRIPFCNGRANQYFNSMIRNTICTRDMDGIVRPDMINLLMQARDGELRVEEEKGEQVEEEDLSNGVPDGTKPKLKDDDIINQAMLFFFAGFETVSNLLCFATYLLALHSLHRERIQEEIESLMRENGNKLTYDMIGKMRYLDMVLSETLRLFPPSPAIDRACVAPINIPETEKDPAIPLNAGDIMWIPIYGLHHDPKHFPEPEKFDPERFSDKNKHNIKPFTYLPFGAGPRNCIGQRFALTEAKVALVHLLSRFDPCVVPKTPIPLKLSKKSLILTAEGDFCVGFKLRNNRTVIQ